MKKLLTVILISLFLVSCNSICWAAGKASMKQSATQTASAAITTSGGLFHGIIFVTNGTNQNTVNIYDNATAASGTKLIPTDTVIPTSSTNRLTTLSFSPPVRFFNGIYVSVDSTISYMVYWENE